MEPYLYTSVFILCVRHRYKTMPCTLKLVASARHSGPCNRHAARFSLEKFLAKLDRIEINTRVHSQLFRITTVKEGVTGCWLTGIRPAYVHKFKVKFSLYRQ